MTTPPSERPGRRVVLRGPGTVRLEPFEAPPPGPGEVRVAVTAALVGGTVWKTVARGGHARFGAPPLPLGHEGVGTIESLGDGVAGWQPGDRVLVGDSAACGRCVACLRARSELCPDALWLTGLFADRITVPQRVVARNLHLVPDGLDPEVAALADNLASVLHGEERTPARPGERALVIGTGPLGRLWCWALARSGVEVTLAGRLAEALDGAARFGAVATRLLASGAPRTPYDLVVEAVGAPETWALALAEVAPGGRVNGFGGPPDGTRVAVDARRLHYEELTLAASFHYAPRHLARALALLAGAGPWRELLEQAPLSLEGLVERLGGPRPTGSAKAVVRP